MKIIELLKNHDKIQKLLINLLSPAGQKVWKDIKDMPKKPSRKLLTMLYRQYD